MDTILKSLQEKHYSMKRRKREEGGGVGVGVIPSYFFVWFLHSHGRHVKFIAIVSILSSQRNHLKCGLQQIQESYKKFDKKKKEPEFSVCHANPSRSVPEFSIHFCNS
jgi:hypothetical protein